MIFSRRWTIHSIKEQGKSYHSYWEVWSGVVDNTTPRVNEFFLIIELILISGLQIYFVGMAHMQYFQLISIYCWSLDCHTLLEDHSA